MGIELERKWRVSKDIVRKCNFNLRYKIRQNYISIKDKKESRVREITNLNRICYFDKIYIIEKKNRLSNNKAEEKEIVINEVIGKEFMDSEVYGKPICKNRYIIREPNKYFMSEASGENFIRESIVDVFTQPVLDYAIIEIEFNNEESMNNFIEPVWFGEELDINNSDIWLKLNKGE